jgi:Tfp pilus assembly protein PilO
MTTRDRLVLIGITFLAVLGAAWILVVAPEREQASKLGAEVSAAQGQLSSAEGQLAGARAAQSQYAAAYASLVSLGKAVPSGQEVPSLIYQLSQATNQRKVEFSSIAAGGGSGSSASSSSTAASAAGFTPMPFTFVFNGSFFDLEHLFHQLDGFAAVTSSGGLRVSGRLLTIQSVKLSPLGVAGATKSSSLLSGTITATAYELPSGQGLAGASSAASPAGSATSTSTATSSSSPTPAAIARVNP